MELFKITVYFKSNVNGIYTKEEEITEEKYRCMKIKRMLLRWVGNLCQCDPKPYQMLEIEELLSMIQDQIKLLNHFDNGDRKFVFNITKNKE